MSYQHDVFISYRRELAWTPWTRDHFKRLLQSYLQADLGEAANIFVDDRIEVGADWVDDLGRHLAVSKVVLTIFSGDYFGSIWCIHELDLILGRSLICSNGLRDARLIIPIVVHDGELIPEELKRKQPANFERFRIAYINEATPDFHEFSKAVKALSPDIKAAIDLAPPFDACWIAQYQERFNDVWKAFSKGKTIAPKNFKWRRPNPPKRPPRLVLEGAS